MLRLFNPPEICKPFSRYSHGAVVDAPSRWLHISGQVGAKPDGTIEVGFEAQAKRSWANLLAILRAADMDVGDIVKTNVFLTRATDVPASRPVREEALKGNPSASTLLIISALAHPDLLIEVEAIAAKAL
jgi:enamine deaminase RidA (YjgF/YER057c/UK114 family)